MVGTDVTRRAFKVGGGTPDTNASLARALELVQTGQTREAEIILTKLAKIAPENADIFGFHGTLKVQAGKHTGAVPLLKRALRLGDGNPTTHGSLGVAYVGLSKPDKAKHHYIRALELDIRALELDPGQARTHVNLGALLWQEGEHSEAVEHYAQAIALEPEFSEAYVYLGRAM